MTTVPPPNVALPQVLAAAAAPTTIVIPQPPPALAAVAAGTTIEALVVPQAAPSEVPVQAVPSAAPIQPSLSLPQTQTVVLHTGVGDIAARLPIQLPPRAQVDLEVVRASPQQATIRIVAVDGTPALQYLAQYRAATATSANPSPPIATPSPPSTGPQPLMPGFTWTAAGATPFVEAGTISALVIQAPVPAVTSPSLELPPSSGTTTPSVAAPSVAAPSVAAPPAAAASGASIPPPSPPAGLAMLSIGSGSELALKVVNVQLPGMAVVAAVGPGPANGAMPLAQMPAAPLAPTTVPPITVAQTSVAAGPIALPIPTNAPDAVVPTPAPQPGLVLASPKGLPPSPPAPPTSVQPSMPLATTAGVVISTANGIPVVEVDGHEIQLNVRANLPVGTKITFEVTAAAPPRVGAPLPLPNPPAAPPLAGPAGAFTGWQTLSESLGVLQRSDPIAAQQLAQAIPDGGPRTAVAVMSFVQAMKSGDARQWPGDTSLRALERAGPRGAHLAATLSGEVAELSARTREGGTEWRALPIPWNAGGEIDRVALITRREGDADGEEKKGRKGSGERFLIDLNLSRLGAMQLDGMFKKQARTFDMILRTKAPLPEEMRRDLTGIFTSSNAAMGLAGGLSFQVTKKFADPLGMAASPDKSGLWA